MKEFLIKNKFAVIFWLIFSLTVIIYTLKIKNDFKKMFYNYKFTTGIITSKWHNKTTWKSAGVDYSFAINNKVTKSGVRKNLNYNKKYLVIFDVNENSTFNIIPFYPLPDSIEAPPNGWRYDEVPIQIDSVRIRKYVLGEE